MAGYNDLGRSLAERFNVTITQGTEMAQHVFDTISGMLEEGEEVRLKSFGTFKLRPTKERVVITPITRKEMVKPASVRVVFTASKELKESSKAATHRIFEKFDFNPNGE